MPISLIRCILYRVPYFSSYKFESLHQFTPANIAARESHGDINTHNTHIWETSNFREYSTKLLHSPLVSLWCVFTVSLVVRSFFFNERCPESNWKPCIVSAERNLEFLYKEVQPALQARSVFSAEFFMQHDAAPEAVSKSKNISFEKDW